MAPDVEVAPTCMQALPQHRGIPLYQPELKFRFVSFSVRFISAWQAVPCRPFLSLQRSCKAHQGPLPFETFIAFLAQIICRIGVSLSTQAAPSRGVHAVDTASSWHVRCIRSIHSAESRGQHANAF